MHLFKGVSTPFTKVAGTSSPKKHLESIHNIYVNLQTINWTKKKNETAMDCYIKMICKDLRSFHSMTTPAFRSFLLTLNENFRPPCVNTIKSKIFQMKENLRKELLAELKAEALFMCYTTDMWSNASQVHYITITGHFVDRKFNLKSEEIDTIEFDTQMRLAQT